MIHRAPIEIIGTAPPLEVTSNALVTNLNADLLDGAHSSDFAPVVHTHVASAITEGVFSAGRLASGVGSSQRVPFATGGATAEWRNISAYDVTDLTDFGIGLAQTTTPGEARAYIGAAASSHSHVVGEVSGAVAYSASTFNRIPFWSGTGVLGNSPLRVAGLSIETDANFGTNGTVTCSDLVVNYDAATSFKSSIYNKLKSTIQGSSSVSVASNDGLQTLTLTATGGGSTPPTGTAGVFVWVVTTPGSGQWLPLVGTT